MARTFNGEAAFGRIGINAENSVFGFFDALTHGYAPVQQFQAAAEIAHDHFQSAVAVEVGEDGGRSETETVLKVADIIAPAVGEVGEGCAGVCTQILKQEHLALLRADREQDFAVYLEQGWDAVAEVGCRMVANVHLAPKVGDELENGLNTLRNT